ncbi:ATP-binding cassette domain-containing protein [Nonomuraea soli]|uniref:ABC-2 type transport system ATP-binding protein n=1 Tax=Nonomuraea soli TaxID=1032476 RepID=A0A7W0CH40_9ACTN|nr:ATP-binding cassette domain-containing protein [Nonomuraea soli]MBA2891060.1 ABC-2 type transport system ATP-binding protein [Nonomuraea soli]
MTVVAEGLSKAYGRHTVLDHLDLTVPSGAIYALLGPNGAGKTTTVRLLATLLRPDSGRASVAGFDVVDARSEVRRRISLTGQHAALDEQQTGEENLRMVARLTGLSRAAARERAGQLLERFALTDAAGRRVKTYSGGMRRRLDLAAGLVGEPEVMFLDEPTTGLDPRSRQAVWEEVARLASAGVTIFLTTQYLEEADRLADRIALLHRGRLVAEGTAAELKHRVAGERLELTLADADAYEHAELMLGGRIVRRDPARSTLEVATDGSGAHVRELLDALDPGRTLVERFAVRSSTLDDVFLEVTADV